MTFTIAVGDAVLAPVPRVARLGAAARYPGVVKALLTRGDFEHPVLVEFDNLAEAGDGRLRARSQGAQAYFCWVAAEDVLPLGE